MDKNLKDLVLKSQEKWSNYILKIGAAYKKKENLDNLVDEFLDKVYAFEHSEVLFKPTLAKTNQFRSKREEFISYFLGENKVCPEDKGFAIKDWKSINFKNFKIIINNGYILSMGNYYFEDSNNTVLKVEYTFGFVQIGENELRINLHHSSLPYDN
tara:strand:+ start:2656 stop:3123 length:468 start_codon:yes stop_codon:yes gene_type:complete